MHDSVDQLSLALQFSVQSEIIEPQSGWLSVFSWPWMRFLIPTALTMVMEESGSQELLLFSQAGAGT